MILRQGLINKIIEEDKQMYLSLNCSQDDCNYLTCGDNCKARVNYNDENIRSLIKSLCDKIDDDVLFNMVTLKTSIFINRLHFNSINRNLNKIDSYTKGILNILYIMGTYDSIDYYVKECEIPLPKAFKDRGHSKKYRKVILDLDKSYKTEDCIKLTREVFIELVKEYEMKEVNFINRLIKLRKVNKNDKLLEIGSTIKGFSEDSLSKITDF